MNIVLKLYRKMNKLGTNYNNFEHATKDSQDVSIFLITVPGNIMIFEF